MGIEGLALMFGPVGLGLFTQEKAEELANEIANSPLTVISPVLGVSLPLFSALTGSGPVTNPLFRAANDNAAPANAEEAVDGITKNLDAAQDLIDQEKWNDAFAVLDGVRKTYFADLPKAQRDAFFEDSKRYSILMGESRRMQALVLRQQGKTEQAQKIVDTALVFFRPEFMEHLPENSPEQAEAFLVRGKLYDLAGDPSAAKADFEAAAKIDPAYQAQVDDYQKAMILYAEEGEKMTVEEAKLAAKDGLIPTDRLDPETALYVTIDGAELKFTEAFDKLPKEEKVVVFQSLFRIARVEKMRQGLDDETDPAKQLYMESQIALTDGNLPLAQLKMVAFKKETKGNEDPAIVAMRNQVRRQLHALSLGSIVRLEERNEAIIAQRRNNPEMLLSSAESHYRYNKNYLENLKGLIKSGRYDTIEDAQTGFKFLARKQDQAFRDNHIVGSTMNAAYLPYKAPQALSDEDLAAKKSDREVMNAYFLPNGEIDPKLFDPEAFPETAYVRLEGGTLKTPVPSLFTDYPGVIRVVVGKEGGEIFTMDRKRISFPVCDREKVVLIRSGNLEANYRHVERHKDYFEEPIPFVEIGFEDNDFDTLLKLETSEGWEKMQTPEARREHLIGVAEELRARNGSYVVAGAILEELLAPALETAFDEITAEEKKQAADEIEGEREKTKTQVNDQLEALKDGDPKAWAARFPDGAPSEKEIEEMVDLAQREKLSCKLKRLAFEKVGEWCDNDQLGDPITRKAWDIYKDMKDPLDEFWNLSDESWDRITDEVVVTVVTLPLTMGAGKLAEIGIQGAAWVGRLARMGRMGFIASRAVTMTGVAATEGFVQQAANPVTVLQILHDANDPSAPAAFRMDEQLKSFGWGMVTSFAFHGGGSLWKRGSTALEIKNPLLNLGGTLTTQTLIASGLGELEPLLFDGEAPGTFFERMGGHAARMVGRHYGTQTFHLATGGQFRQNGAPKIEENVVALPMPDTDLSLARQSPKAKTIPTSGPDDVTKVEPKGKSKTDPIDGPAQRQQPQRKTVVHPDEGTAGPHDKTRVVGNGTAVHRTRVLESSLMSSLSFTEANTNGLKDPNKMMSFKPIRNEQGRIAGVRILVTEGGAEDVVTALKAKGILEPTFKMAEGQDTIDVPNPDGDPIQLKFAPIETPSTPAKAAPNVPTSSNKSSLLPADAAFAGIGPAAGFIADFFGASPTAAAILGVAGMLLPTLGMVFSRSRIHSTPEVLRPQSKDTPIGLNKEGMLGWVTVGDKSGYAVSRTGAEQILVNGKPLPEGSNWAWVTSGDVIKAGGKTYTFETGFEKEPTSIRDGQREAARPYKLDDNFRTMDGPSSAGAYKANPGADVEGRFVSVKTDDGRTVSVMVEGKGRSIGQSNAAVETEASLPGAINGGSSLDAALGAARAHVESPYRKDDGTVRAGAPTLKASGVEMKTDATDPNKVNARVVADAGLPVVVVRLGGGNKPVVVTEGAREMTLQAGNDIVVAGGSLSPDAVAYIVKNTKPATADAIRDNLQQEALIRAKIMEDKPQGGKLTAADYRAAYRGVTGKDAPQGWHGLYEGGFLAPNGKVYDGAGNPANDAFSATPGGFLVQVAGK